MLLLFLMSPDPRETRASALWSLKLTRCGLHGFAIQVLGEDVAEEIWVDYLDFSGVSS